MTYYMNRGNHNQRINCKIDRDRMRARRVRECAVKRKLLITVLALLLITAGVLLGSSFLASSKSNASNEAVQYKYYTSIEVEQGDTLWTIAERYMDITQQNRTDYIDELVTMNHLTCDTIHAGDYIMVAYYSDEFK